MSAPTSTTRSRAPRPWPTPATLVDLGVLVVLLGVAFSGWSTTFTGAGYWWVAMVGVLLAAGTVVLTRRAGLPAAFAVLVVVGLFFLLGGPLTLRSLGDTTFLPWLSADELVDRLLHGWKELLTTLPPVDGAGPLLVLPWVLGLVSGAAAGILATLERPRGWVRGVVLLAVPGGLLAVVIALGVARPASLLWQGSVLTVLALGWLVLVGRRESARDRDRAGGRGRVRHPWSQTAAGAALVLVAGGVALPVSDWLFGEPDRVVVRDHVEPPFDIGQYPSPLASFRNYVDLEGRRDPTNVFNTELFRVEGLRAGDRVRFAALDHWDGMVYGATNDALGPQSGDDGFQRVSSRIDNPAEGRTARVEVRLGPGYRGVWLPTAGALQGIEFERGDVHAKRETFRYNLATSTAVVPSGLHPGDSYEFEAVVADEELTPDMEPSTELGPLNADTEFLNRRLERWVARADDDMGRVFAVAERLRREGRYSDGVRRSERSYYPGHGLRRLSDGFFNAQTMAGNDEQYAAVMALLANRLGIPARVVMGAVVPESGVVEGRHVEAWVEVRTADGRWRTLPTETFMSRRPPSEQQPETQQPMTGTVVPPPAPIPPPSDLGESADSDLRAQMEGDDAAAEDGAGGGVPAWLRAVLLYLVLPLLLLVLLVGSILGAKALRRWRRRNAATASARVAGAWRELVDHARDLGRPVPRGASVTRREQSTALGSDQAPALARTADGHVFGPQPPTEEDAAGYWAEVLAERRTLARQVDRWQRVRAALSLATFGLTLPRRRDWRFLRPSR